MLPPCLLSGKCPILEAYQPVKFQISLRPGGLEGLSKFIEPFLAAKNVANRRPRYTRSLSHYLYQFSRSTRDLPIEVYTTEIIEDWIGKYESPYTRQTWLNRLSTFFAFQVRRGRIANNPCDKIERISIGAKFPIILDPSQSEKALHFVRRSIPRFLIWITLTTFCGIRPEEADKITPAMIELKNYRVNMPKEICKGGKRPRIVPIPPVAMEWLKFGGDYQIPLRTRQKYIQKIRDFLDLKRWPQDVLRHTAASMMLAKHQDAGKVATWLGNSVKVLLSTYIVTPEPEAVEKFFNLYPLRKEIVAVPSNG